MAMQGITESLIRLDTKIKGLEPSLALRMVIDEFNQLDAIFNPDGAWLGEAIKATLKNDKRDFSGLTYAGLTRHAFDKGIKVDPLFWTASVKKSSDLPPLLSTKHLLYCLKLNLSLDLFLLCLRRSSDHLDRACIIELRKIGRMIGRNDLYTFCNIIMNRFDAKKCSTVEFFNLKIGSIVLFIEKFHDFILTPPLGYYEPDISLKKLIEIFRTQQTSIKVKLEFIKSLNNWLNFYPIWLDYVKAEFIATNVWGRDEAIGPFVYELLFKLKATVGNADLDIDLTSYCKDSKTSLSKISGHLKALHVRPTRDELVDFLAYQSISHFADDEIQFHGVLYGHDYYFSSASLYGLNSLISSASYSRISREYRVTFNIHTTVESLPKLESLRKVFLDFSIDYRFYTTLGTNDADAQCSRGLAWLLAMRSVGYRNGTFIFFTPDCIYGEGLDHLLRNCPTGGGSTGLLLRVSALKTLNLFPEGYRHLPSLSQEERNEYLLRIGTTALFHPFQILQFGNISPLYNFEESKSLCLYSTSRNLVWIIKFTPELARSIPSISVPRYNNSFFEHLMQPVDHELSSYLAQRGLLSTTASAREFVGLELSNDRGYTNFSKGISSFYSDESRIKIEIPFNTRIDSMIERESFRFWS